MPAAPARALPALVLAAIASVSPAKTGAIAPPAQFDEDHTRARTVLYESVSAYYATRPLRVRWAAEERWLWSQEVVGASFRHQSSPQEGELLYRARDSWVFKAPEGFVFREGQKITIVRPEWRQYMQFTQPDARAPQAEQRAYRLATLNPFSYIGVGGSWHSPLLNHLVRREHPTVLPEGALPRAIAEAPFNGRKALWIRGVFAAGSVYNPGGHFHAVIDPPSRALLAIVIDSQEAAEHALCGTAPSGERLVDSIAWPAGSTCRYETDFRPTVAEHEWRFDPGAFDPPLVRVNGFHDPEQIPAVLHEAELIGTTAPDFPLRSADGVESRLADFCGSVVVLSFWNSSDEYGYDMLMNTQRFHEELFGEWVVFCSVITDRDAPGRQAALALAEQAGADHRIIFDDSQEIASYFGVTRGIGQVTLDTDGRTLSTRSTFMPEMLSHLARGNENPRWQPARADPNELRAVAAAHGAWERTRRR